MALFKHMSSLFHLKGRENPLLLRWSMRELKLKNPHKRTMLKKRWHSLQRTFASSWSSKRMGSPLRKENSPILRKTWRTSKWRIPKILLLLKESLVMSATGMVIWRKNALPIWRERVELLLQPLVIRIA